MQVTVEELSPVKRKISIEVPAETVSSEIEKAFSGIQKKATVSGFRKGKAPMAMIKRLYQGAMQEEVMRRLYEQTLFPAMKDHNIDPVDAPMIDDMALIEHGTPFKYSALIEVMPLILLKDYKGLEVKKERFNADTQAVESEIERMRENMAQLVPVEEGAVEAGMVLTVDYRFVTEGDEEAAASGQDASIEVGSGKLLPGLEDGLIGMTCGETKDIAVTVPETADPANAGKNGVFTITLKEMKRKELPALDDEFAQQFGEFDTVEEMRTKLGEMREQHELDRITTDLKTRVIDALIEKNPLDVPDSMVRRQVDFMLENMKNRLKGQNMTIEMMGLTEDGFRQRFWNEATQKVKGGLLVMALVEEENITVEEADLDARYEKLANGNPDLVQRIKDFYSTQDNVKNSMTAEIKEDKAIDFLLQNATVTEVDAADLAEQPKAE